MINVKPEVLSKLKEIGPKVFYAYPASFEELPCMSYYEIGNSADEQIDDVEYISDISIQIDIWNIGSTSTLAESVDAKMKSLGFKRTFGADVPEGNRQHKTLRYRGRVDNEKNLVYQ